MNHTPLQYVLGGYREYAPPPPLAAFCESVWTYRTPPSLTDATHRVLPDPSVNIGYAYLRDACGRLCDVQLIVLGPKTRPQLTTYARGREVVALKVKVEWAAFLTGAPSTDLLDAAVEIDDVDPQLARHVEAAVVDTHTIEQSMHRLITTFSRFLCARRQPKTPTAAAALDLMRRTHGQRAVEQIADDVGVSARYLRRAVHRESGVSLKGYGRTIRLLHAIAIADAQHLAAPVSWARVAADAGFCDQSHLIRECQALCGLTPGHVVRERRIEQHAAAGAPVEAAHLRRPDPVAPLATQRMC